MRSFDCAAAKLLMAVSLSLSFSCEVAVAAARAESLSFEFGVYGTPAAGEGLGGVDVFVGITNKRLQFVKKRGRWIADYSITIDLLTEDGTRVKGKTVEHRRTAKGYRFTNDATIRQVTHMRFDMPGGRFRVAARVRDEDLRTEIAREKTVEVGSVLGGDLGLSDIILLADREEAASGRFADFQSIYFETKSDQEGTLYAVFRVVGKMNGEAGGRALFRHPSGNVVRDAEFGLPAEEGWRFIELSAEGLPTTVYDIEVSLSAYSGMETRAKRKLIIRSAGVSPLVSDLGEAIDQLRYIAEKNERDRMKEAHDEEKRSLFEAFWKARDPSPGTPDNELMDEYYRRINEADTRFRCYKAGWKTDRGWVFVTHGEPNEIERYPFELETHPYEVWRYFNPERRFVFVDRNGFGDYDMVESTGGNFRYGVD